jgi:ABC-2 type transport system permease protein
VNLRAVRAIARKDLLAVRRSRSVMLPLVLVPLLLFIGLPALIGGILANVPVDSGDLDDLERLVREMPPAVQQELERYSPTQRVLVITLNELLAPLYLLVPLMVSIVIAADSLAGERERKTLEALLYTPISDQELLLGKLLSAWVPAILVSLAGFVAYGVTANLVAWPVMGRIFFPNATWLVLALWTGPAAAGFGLGVMILVSARVRGFQEAYQLGGLVVLPFIALMVSQSVGLIYLSPWLALGLGVLIWALDALLLWLGSHALRRDALLTRQ